PEGWIKTISFIFISPLVGMILGIAFTVAIAWIFRRRSPSRVDRFFRRGQLFSAALYSLGHGGAAAQKTMGNIAPGRVAGEVQPRSTALGTAGRTRKKRWALSPQCSSPERSTRKPQNIFRCGSS